MLRNLFLITLLLLTAGFSLVGANTLLFNHEAHLETYLPGIECSQCHEADARSIVPDRDVCLNCHDNDLVSATDLGAVQSHGPVWALNHGGTARGGSMDCTACHQQSFCLDCHDRGVVEQNVPGAIGSGSPIWAVSGIMIKTHTSDFHITHPVASRGNQQLCTACHEVGFCTDCHTEFRSRLGRTNSPSHRRVFDMGMDGDISSIHAGMDVGTSCDSCHLHDSVSPSFHDWSVGHAREARRTLVTCQSCHPSGDTCLKCHSSKGGVVGFNPHGKGWSGRSDRLENASGGKTCKMCH